MTYAWNDPDRDSINRTHKDLKKPLYSFTIIIPALHEEDVISTTIQGVANIDYPKDLFEIFIVNRSDDEGTISEVTKTIKMLEKKGINNVRLLIPDFRPRNKPDKLNFAFTKSTKDIVVVFDAEDEVHPDILKVVNSHFMMTDADVIQGGVQLMNHRSTWFSGLNCLEYYYWFKSALHLFSKWGVTTLGGVTVFFKKEWLSKVDGWDAGCLTEDGDIGIRMSLQGAKIRVIYDEEIATKESTPLTIEAFIKQRTRWDLGFLQMLRKGDWNRMDSFKKRFLAFYILITPLGQSFSIAFIPFMIGAAFLMDMPVFISLLSTIPLFMMLIILVIQIIIMWDFTRVFKLKFPIWMPIKMAFFFIPYIFMLSFAAVRAIVKYFSSDFAWEKTPHNNTHRETVHLNSIGEINS